MRQTMIFPRNNRTTFHAFEENLMNLVVSSLLLGAIALSTSAGEGSNKPDPAAATGLDALKPLTEPGFYEKDGRKYERGLYPGGKNEMPEPHRKAGEKIARTIVPLSRDGLSDKDGEIVVVAMGHSNPRAYFKFMSDMIVNKSTAVPINPKLRLQSKCSDGKMCNNWAAKHSFPDVKNIQVIFLLTSYPQANVPATEKNSPGYLALSFEQRMARMKADLVAILQGMVKNNPHLKMAWLGCDVWRGNTGLEPVVYEEGFVFKRLIEDQIKGDPELAFDGPNKKAPWLAWGGYPWENNPARARFVADGVHPTDLGKTFVVGRWLDVLTKDSAATPWFLAEEKK